MFELSVLRGTIVVDWRDIILFAVSGDQTVDVWRGITRFDEIVPVLVCWVRVREEKMEMLAAESIQWWTLNMLRSREASDDTTVL